MKTEINLKWSDSMSHFISDPYDILADWVPLMENTLPAGDVTCIYVEHFQSNYNNDVYIVEDSVGDFWECSRDSSYCGFEVTAPQIEPIELWQFVEFVDYEYA